MAAKYRLAAIGTGRWQRAILNKIKNRNDVSVAYICDSRPDQLAYFTGDFPSAVTAVDYKQIDHVDVAVVATDPKYHFPISMHFLQHGAHVFATKPVALKKEGIDELAKEQQKEGKKLALISKKLMFIT